MAQKRMFDKKVVESDKFIDLPNSAKALYFMAGMDADDKGFFQPRKLQRLCGFADDDYKILLAKGFFITFESGVMVITDWNKNNWLDSRRVNETEYLEELQLLKLINDKYELDTCLANAKPMLRENSIEENSIEENKYDDVYGRVESELCMTLSPTNYEKINYLIETYGEDKFIKAIETASNGNKKSLNYVEGILKNKFVNTKKVIDAPKWMYEEIPKEEEFYISEEDKRRFGIK